MYTGLLIFYRAVIFFLPLGFSLAPYHFELFGDRPAAALFVAPLLFALSFPLVAGFLSIPVQGAIISGTFPRKDNHKIYGKRKLYGLCWTSVYYFSVLYHAILAVPSFKFIILRLFGYRGHPDFALYPDTWIRDLPLLDFEKGVYLSNKATIGTNICLASGHILVDGISIGGKGLIGHLCMIAPGAEVGNKSEIGVGTAVGIRAIVGNRTRVGGTCAINHGVSVGNNCTIGVHSYVGIKAKIADDIKIPAGANIPAGAQINTQEDVNSYMHSETELLKARRQELEQEIRRNNVVIRPLKAVNEPETEIEEN